MSAAKGSHYLEVLRLQKMVEERDAALAAVLEREKAVQDLLRGYRARIDQQLSEAERLVPIYEQFYRDLQAVKGLIETLTEACQIIDIAPPRPPRKRRKRKA